PEHAQAAHALQDALILQVLLHHVQVRHRHDVIEDVDFHGCESVWSPESGAWSNFSRDGGETRDSVRVGAQRRLRASVFERSVRAHCYLTSSSLTPRPARKLA